MSSNSGKIETNYDMIDKLHPCSTYIELAKTASENPQYVFKSSCASILSTKPSLSSKFSHACETLLAYFKIFNLGSIPFEEKISCSYANYWLNEEVRKVNENYNEHTYNFFSILTSSPNKDINDSVCKPYIYDFGNERFPKMKILYEFYNHYNNYLICKANNQNASCASAEKCAQAYKENIDKCLISEDEFCSTLRKFKNKLMHDMNSSNICISQQNSLSQIDKAFDESLKHRRTGVSTVVTISTSIIGIILGVVLILIFVYKLNPLIGIKKRKHNIEDNEDIQSLFHVTNLSHTNFSTSDYNIPYNIIENY
ncbi:PIR protein [Plasmodium ovale]|uniref:PIR Superfamily Protein n=2 Tax=Plasmodium ovale TaxID=36330 RepID=A0A1A8WNH7_PLAOA|nr:PIR Superfamily Protein [Plasmodium ovale curtisi]SBT01691.1 PIR Superfamily Protein [Plasmodium ovale curtisi]SBT84366.1 PIR protein [Plasmodium ovale]